MTTVLDELAWRGLLHQTTADEALPEFLATPGRVAYCGFDPTADTLAAGRAHARRAGGWRHRLDR